MKPRRVLVLAVQAPFVHGGAERHVRRLTEELSRRGVEADLVAMPLGETRAVRSDPRGDGLAKPRPDDLGRPARSTP